MTAEEKAKEFLAYVGRHHVRLRYNLAKNVSYDPELFENAFQEAIIRVYDAILRNDPNIKDYEKYFFMASRKWYITLSDREKKRALRESGEISDRETLTSGDTPVFRMPATLAEVRNEIETTFGKEACDLFMDYMLTQVRGRISYKKFEEESGIPSVKVKAVVFNIRKHLKSRYPRMTEGGGAPPEDVSREVIEKIRKQFGDGLDRETEENPSQA